MRKGRRLHASTRALCERRARRHACKQMQEEPAGPSSRYVCSCLPPTARVRGESRPRRTACTPAEHAVGPIAQPARHGNYWYPQPQHRMHCAPGFGIMIITIGSHLGKGVERAQRAEHPTRSGRLAARHGAGSAHGARNRAGSPRPAEVGSSGEPSCPHP